MKAGINRIDALRTLAERTGVADVKSLVAVLVQTDRLGTSIAASLRAQSDSLRIKRRQRAEEAAHKVAVKLVFPLVLCIFPELLVSARPGLHPRVPRAGEHQLVRVRAATRLAWPEPEEAS